MTRQELEALEKASDRRLSWAMWGFCLTALFSFVALGVGMQGHSHGWGVAAVVLLFVHLVVYVWLGRKSERLSNRIWAAAQKEYVGTEWVTPAGAKGVTVEALSRGRRLKLAFPTGVIETYLKASLSPAAKEPEAEEAAAQ